MPYCGAINGQLVSLPPADILNSLYPICKICLSIYNVPNWHNSAKYILLLITETKLEIPQIWVSRSVKRMIFMKTKVAEIPHNRPFFTRTAEIVARSLANFYCQYADRHMNLKFMRRVSERERVIRPFVIVRNKLMSVFNESVLLLKMNFVIKLSK